MAVLCALIGRVLVRCSGTPEKLPASVRLSGFRPHPKNAPSLTRGWRNLAGFLPSGFLCTALRRDRFHLLIAMFSMN
jgi:hypothetical protein